MPLTAMEAQSCGRPVVAFDIGGLPDIVEHEVTGHLSPFGDTEGLARGLILAVNDAQAACAWGRAARQRALSTWSGPVVVQQYERLYVGITQ